MDFFTTFAQLMQQNPQGIMQLFKNQQLQPLALPKLAQNQQNTDVGVPNQPMDVNAQMPLQSPVRNNILNNMASGMDFTDAVMKGPSDKLKAMSQIAKLFGIGS